MSISVLKLPEDKVQAERPAKYPSCGGDIFQRWGGNIRKVRDPNLRELVGYRYHCWTCRLTYGVHGPARQHAEASIRLASLHERT